MIDEGNEPTPEFLRDTHDQFPPLDRDHDEAALLQALKREIEAQDNRHGPYGSQGGTLLGVSRLAISTLEDEVAEALEAWREERQLPHWQHTRREVLQVAAVAIRTLRDAL